MYLSSVSVNPFLLGINRGILKSLYKFVLWKRQLLSNNWEGEVIIKVLMIQNSVCKNRSLIYLFYLAFSYCVCSLTVATC